MEQQDEEPTEAAFAGATTAVRGRGDVEPAPAAGGGCRGAPAAFVLLETLHKEYCKSIPALIAAEKMLLRSTSMHREP